MEIAYPPPVKVNVNPPDRSYTSAQWIALQCPKGCLPHVSCQNYECNGMENFQKCHDSVKIEQDFSRQRMTSEVQKCANKENAMVSAQSRKRKREAMHLEMQQENEELEE
ncbi:hypothetical protein EMCRGX_G003445 [Ephydatia muelleri]